MIEVNVTYDFLPGMDQQAYGELAKKVIDTVLRAPGLIEFRANRNILGSPYARGTSVWETLADWARFSESAEYQALEAEVRAFVTDINVQIWGPSPVLPEPLRPGE